MAPDFSYETEITINRSPDTVFDYLTNLEAIPEWAEPIKRVESTSSGPLGTGSTFDEVVKTPIGESTVSWEILEYQEGRLCTFRSDSFIARSTVTFLVEPSRRGTLLKVEGAGRGKGPLRLLDSHLGSRALRLRQESLGVIKRILEAENGGPG